MLSEQRLGRVPCFTSQHSTTLLQCLGRHHRTLEASQTASCFRVKEGKLSLLQSVQKKKKLCSFTSIPEIHFFSSSSRNEAVTLKANVQVSWICHQWFSIAKNPILPNVVDGDVNHLHRCRTNGSSKQQLSPRSQKHSRHTSSHLLNSFSKEKSRQVIRSVFFR